MATLSDKQAQIMEFPYTQYSALICDGAVRSGKTSIMALSFFLRDSLGEDPVADQLFFNLAAWLEGEAGNED